MPLDIHTHWLLLVQICGNSYDSSRYLCEQRLWPCTTSVRAVSLTAANNAISRGFSTGLKTLVALNIIRRSKIVEEVYTGEKTLQFNLIDLSNKFSTRM